MKKLTLVAAILMMSNMLSAQWIQLQNPYPNSNDTLLEIYFTDQDHGFIGGSPWEEGHLMGTSDGGNNWFYELDFLFIYPISISFPDQNNGWLLSDYNGNDFKTVYHTSDGGFNLESWELMETQDFWGAESIYFTDSLNGWICGGSWGGMYYYRYVYSTIDGGLSWNESYTDNGESLYDVFFINDSTGWAVGESGLVVYTNDKGETWLFSSTPPNGESLRAVQFVDNDNGCVVGKLTNETGLIFKSYDGGINWEQKLGDTIPPLNDLVFIDELNGWAIGNSGTILHTDDGGETWEYQESGTNADLNKVCFVDVNNSWICGLNGTILYTDNGGTVGINKIFRKDNSMEVFPNPATYLTTISFELAQIEKITLSIINTKGQEVKQMNLGTQEKGQINLDCSNFSSGVYFINLQTEKGILTEKIIIE